MHAQRQRMSFVTPKGRSISTVASFGEHERIPLASISDNTICLAYMSGSGDAVSMSGASVDHRPSQLETLMASKASPWDTYESRSKPSKEVENSIAQPPSITATRQEMDMEPSRLHLHDATMANLASKIQDNVVIRDVAVQAPKMITVPQGYAVTYDTKPAEHYRDRREVKVHIKRKRDEGVLSKPSGGPESNELYGFRAHEVNAAGAVALQDCQASTLTNDIHPLLARARFDDTPDAIYDQLVPALRLASNFLTQPVCMQFWVTLAFAERRDDREMSFRYGKRCQRIGEHVKMTNENVAAVTKRLEEMGHANLIHFAFRNRTAMPQNDIWGCSWPIRDYRGAARKGLTRSLIRLHADYYIVAEKLSQLKYPEQSQILRFSFIFAVIVLHELAHSIEGAYIKMRHDQWHDLLHTKQYLEPFFMDWRRPPECGRTLEHMMFGGEIHPINKRVDGSHGVCTSDWPPHSSMGDSQRRIWYTVPMDYIQDLFKVETWQRQGHLHAWKAFHIPRTGATSLYIFSFTTMPWSEEQRAAKEEAAELLAIAKAQPATKKRLIASGKEEEQRNDEKIAIETAIGKEEAAEVVNRLARSRRHSSFILDAYCRPSQTTGRPPRSRSVDPEPKGLPLTQDAASSKAAAEDLLRSFLGIYDSLPARCDSDTAMRTKPASELVKEIRKKRSRTPRKRKQPRRTQTLPVKVEKLKSLKNQQPKAVVEESLEHKT